VTPPLSSRSLDGKWPKVARLFWPLLIAAILAGLTRSWVATRWDSLNIDEAWHTVAGVTYARTGDYRINPEHPPLVKLWVGAALPESRFELPSFRPMLDKLGERDFINEAMYLANDADKVHGYARLAMLALHGLLMLGLALCLRRAFGPAVALASTALLLLDPTVAAHLPVVMTDLSVALLSGCSVLLALFAMRSRRAIDVALAGLALGLALASKHSGVITIFAVLAVIGGQVIIERVRGRALHTRLGLAAAILLGSYVVLWSFYGFRFREDTTATAHIGHGASEASSPSTPTTGAPPAAGASAAAAGGEIVHFNRSMADKLADLRSDVHRKVLGLALDAHLLPRAYLWGLADILRVGMEGRYETLYVFGHYVEGKTPWYFFPAVIVAKLPLGVLALAVLGAWLVARGLVPASVRAPLGALATLAGLYLFFLMRGNSGYAGVRHALPTVPLVFTLAGVAALSLLGRRHAFSAERSPKERSVREPSARAWLVLRGTAALALVGAAASALPVMRPWEYYNELAGGTEDGWRYFTDDGVDIRQRTKELAWYYDAYVRGTDRVVYEFYDISAEERKARGFSFRALTEDPSDTDVLSGTLFVNARWLAERPLYDFAALREATPVARFGNLMVYQGEFKVPWIRAARRVARAWEALSAEPRAPERAERLLEEAADLYPDDFGSSLELGNLRLERGAREAALGAYAQALAHAPAGDGIANVLSQRIDDLRRGRDADLGPIRNPWLE
jgi:tetratricopeptide (TPR) repeat protein